MILGVDLSVNIVTIYVGYNVVCIRIVLKTFIFMCKTGLNTQVLIVKLTVSMSLASLHRLS